MNLAQFKDPLCYLCHAGAEIAFLSFTQEVAGLNELFKIQYVVTEFSENI